MKKAQWFEVDKEGLGRLVANRGSAFAIFELLQNAWDTNTTFVDVSLELVGRNMARLIVVDDDPTGFEDLTHAFTLFAESKKKGDPTKRGRFNFGEKLVLALCREAQISSTSGTIVFNSNGTRSRNSQRRDAGSAFEANIPMTRHELDEGSRQILRLLPPPSVRTTFNGSILETRTPVTSFEDTLPTVRSDDAGILRPTSRVTTVEIHETSEGEQGWIYEMGIPVVETGDRFHVNVLQKVPLNFDRDNVTPAYLRAARALVLNHTAHLITKDEAAAPWITAALEDKRVSSHAVAYVVEQRFGAGAVAYDPSDTEAGQKATGVGLTVVHGGTFSRLAWTNIRAAEVLKPAGQVFPTPRPYGDGPGTAAVIDPFDYSIGMRQVVDLTTRLAEQLMNVSLQIDIVNTSNSFRACYERRSEGAAKFDYNLKWLGHDFFDEWQSRLDDVLGLIVHEFGHQYASNHLSDDYHKAITSLAGKLAVLALRDPSFFTLEAGSIVASREIAFVGS